MNDGTMPQPVTASSLITDEEKKYFEQQAEILRVESYIRYFTDG